MAISLLVTWFKLVKFGIKSTLAFPGYLRQILHQRALDLAALAAPRQDVAIIDDFSDDDVAILYTSLSLLALGIFAAGIFVGRLSAKWSREHDHALQLANEVTPWVGTPSRTSTPPPVLRSQSSPNLVREPLGLQSPCNRQLVFPVPLRSPRAAPKANRANQPLDGNLNARSPHL